MRPIATILTSLTLAAVLGGCSTAGRQEGALYSQGSTAMVGTYYAELYDTDRRRWYVFFSETTAQGFKNGEREMPLSKTLIGAGPERTTVVLEQTKDEEQSAIRSRRVLEIFQARHPRSAPAPAAPTSSGAATNG
jgi:hypothetical protein